MSASSTKTTISNSENMEAERPAWWAFALQCVARLHDDISNLPGSGLHAPSAAGPGAMCAQDPSVAPWDLQANDGFKEDDVSLPDSTGGNLAGLAPPCQILS